MTGSVLRTLPRAHPLISSGVSVPVVDDPDPALAIGIRIGISDLPIQVFPDKVDQDLAVQQAALYFVAAVKGYFIYPLLQIIPSMFITVEK